MKKKIGIALMLLIAMFSFMLSASAADTISLEINGTIVKPAVDPVIENGSTLVPLRIVSEQLGAEVAWNGEERSIHITKGTDDLRLVIDQKQVSVNGTMKTLNVAPKIINSSTMVPIRFVSESLGAFVNWDAEARCVQISESNNFVKPEISIPNQNTYQELTVRYLNVGQADAALLTCGDESLLIDGGNAEDSQLIYTVLKNAGINHLDKIIITHGHADHVGGVSGALSASTVDTVYSPVTSYDSKAFQNVLKKSNITVPKAGESFSLGSATVEILGPVKSYEEPNNTSIVCKVTNGNDSFLFTGDMEMEAERDLIATGAVLDVDVLKVGHHGADTSSSIMFLREVMPKHAIISVGTGNSYGHPTEQTLSRLRDVGATVYRTDLQGDITVISTGNGISVQTEKNKNVDTFIPGDASESVKQENTVSVNTSVEGNWIGNAKSHVIHVKTCHSLPSEQNRIYVNDLEQALADGYKPCGNCMGGR